MIYDPQSSLRIGAFSGFYGDRPDAMELQLRAGVDVLVGDYLAELTMLILRKNQLRGRAGYAPSFVEQVGRNLQAIKAGGVKVVVNAGGLDPDGCADAVRALCVEQGVDLVVASISGDDIRDSLAGLGTDELLLTNMDTGEHLDLTEREILTANAYLGAWPIVEALNAGADIVVCPRMTDASLVVGPAAWKFGWDREDWDALAGAVVVGHLIECGGQATGGNYSRFHELGSLGIAGFPIAEMTPDGSSTISKLPGSGGVVNVDTVKSQLFYEIGGPEYLNPDVITDLTSVVLTDLGDDRVRVSSVRGRMPTPTTKVSLTYEGGYRNSMTIGITGGHVTEKVAWLKDQVTEFIGGAEDFDGFRWAVIGPSANADGDYDASTAFAILNVRDGDRRRVGRAAFSDKIVQLCLSSIPGFYMTNPPADARLFGVQFPCLIAKDRITTVVKIDGQPDVHVPWGPATGAAPSPAGSVAAAEPGDTAGETVRVLLGDIVLTRSGDKGGSANIGVWTRSEAAYEWLQGFLTTTTLQELLPEARGLRVVRHEFPNLLGLNFLLYGYLEDGVSSCLRIDPQAKGLGEYLGSKTVSIPADLA